MDQVPQPGGHEPFGLQDLPRELLEKVLQTAGRSARLTCQQLLAVYSSHRRGVWLEGYSTPQLWRILRQQCKRLEAASSLKLNGVSEDVDARKAADGRIRQLFHAANLDDLDLYGGVAALVAQAFPLLQSLALPDDMLAVESDLQDLASLGSCMTALRLNLWGDGPYAAVRGLAPFTALRSLSIARWSKQDLEGPDQVEQWLRSLEHLPSLEHLDLRAKAVVQQCGCQLSARQWVPGLARSAPQLTSLALGPAVDWDGGATGALRDDFPALRRLSMELQDWRNAAGAGGIEPDGDAGRFGALASALRQRTGLSWMRMSTKHLFPYSFIPLPEQVQDLSVSCQSEDDEHVQAQLHAVARATALTRLEIRTLDSSVAAAGVVGALLTHRRTLQELHCVGTPPRNEKGALPTLVACTVLLPKLRVLNLLLHSSSDWPARSRGLLAGMTRLEELRVPVNCMPTEVVRSIASLTRLTTLELGRMGDSVPAGVAQAVDALLQQLQPLQSLVRLLLTCGGTDVSGLGLLALRRLRGLQELELVLDGQTPRALRRLPVALLPLACSMRRLRVEGAAVPAAAYDAIAAAAQSVGCVLYMQRSPCL